MQSYPRGAYAQFTREINKRIDIPTVVVFRTANGAELPLAFVNRRVNKLDADRDVLGNVSLIREIDPRKAAPRTSGHTARAVLRRARLKWMDSRDKPRTSTGCLPRG